MLHVFNWSSYSLFLSGERITYFHKDIFVRGNIFTRIHVSYCGLESKGDAPWGHCNSYGTHWYDKVLIDVIFNGFYLGKTNDQFIVNYSTKQIARYAK